MPANVKEGRMFHVPHDRPYHQENSVQGIDEAARHGFDSIDLDMQITKSDPHCTHHPDGERCTGHEVGCHWSQPMLKDGFTDPLGLLDKRRAVSTMTLEEVLRLRTADGFRIEPIPRLMRRVARKGLVASLEAKSRSRWSVQRMQKLRNAAVRVHCPAIVKSAFAAPVDAARAAGWQVRFTKDHKPGT